MMAVKPGFIYILIHPSDRNLVKVGVTTRHPETRLKEHNKHFNSIAGKTVQETGQEWILKEYFPLLDIYNAESAFWHRSPATEFPYFLCNEVIRLNEAFPNWAWVEEGIQAAKDAGIREDISQPPIPKPKPKRGANWIEDQLKGSGLRPIKGLGNGITKVAFECPNGHIFKLSGYTVVRFPFCPVCKPELFDAYTLRRIEYP